MPGFQYFADLTGSSNRKALISENCRAALCGLHPTPSASARCPPTAPTYSKSDRPKYADPFKSEAGVQGNRCSVPTIADNSNHLPPVALLAAGNQPGKESTTHA